MPAGSPSRLRTSRRYDMRRRKRAGLKAGLYKSDTCLQQERAVAFVAEFGKGTGRSRNGIRNEREIAYFGAPLHLRGVTDEFAREAAEYWVGVVDIEPFVHSAPYHLERHGSWHGCRTAAEQCIGDISIIEDGYIGRLESRTSFSNLRLDAGHWNFG